MAAERGRRDAVGQRVEARSRRRKPPHFEGVLAPASLRERVGVVVEVGVPALGRDLGDRVGRRRRCWPRTLGVRRRRGRTQAIPTMAMSSGVALGLADPSTAQRRARGAAARRCASLTSACRSATVVTAVRSAATSPIMYMPSRALLGPRRRGTSPASPRSRPLAAIRSRPRLSCSSSAQRALGLDAGGLEPALRAREGLGRSRSRRSGWRGPGAVSSSTVASHATATVLEGGLDRPARDRLLGEQVRGAHQHADLRARARPAGRRAAATIAAERASWMPPAKQHARARRRPSTCEQPLDLGVPQREARARADVAAALAALEDEAAGAVLEEPVQQARRRHVEVGRDARPPPAARPGRAGRRR